MKHFIAKLMTVILPLGLLSGTANAALLLEPYVGYMPAGKIKVGTAEKTLTGVTLGARAGYSNILGLQLGLDYSTGALKDDATVVNEYTPTNLAAFVGWDFPILLRVWAGVGLTSSTEVKNATGTATYDKGAKYMKFGAGFTPLPLVSINLEYINSQYEESGTNITASGLVLGASLPLEL